jgi:hypothetical protein
VWGKRKAGGKKHGVRYESLGFESEVVQEEAVRGEREPSYISRLGRVRERGSLLRGREACYSPEADGERRCVLIGLIGTDGTTWVKGNQGKGDCL